MDNIGFHAVIQGCRFKLDKHSPYLPVMAPSPLYVSLKMSKELSRHYFDSNYNVFPASDHCMRVQDTKFIKEEIQMLHDC